MKKVWLILSLAAILLMSACGSGTTNENSSPNEDNQAAVTEQTIYEDGLISVTFQGLSEVAGIEATYIGLNVVNHSEGEITVYMKDGYVNDLMVNVGSGVPLTIAAGKQGNNAFVLMHGTTGDFPAMEDITEVGFKLWVVDENTETLLDTDTIVVNP